jgi:hypothetical protein
MLEKANYTVELKENRELLKTHLKSIGVIKQE